MNRDWLREIQLLKRLPRTGWFRVGVERPESIADHSFSMALLVWKLAREAGDVDVDRCVRMALVHDVHEARLGDLPTPAKRHLSPEALMAAERDIAAEQWRDDPEARALVEEFLAGQTPEARLVKAVDHLEFLLQADEYRREGRPLPRVMLERARGGAAWNHPLTRPWVERLLAPDESPG